MKVKVLTLPICHLEGQQAGAGLLKARQQHRQVLKTQVA